MFIRFPLRFTQADQGQTRSDAAVLPEEAGCWLLASTSGVSKNNPPDDVRRGNMACTACLLPLAGLDWRTATGLATAMTTEPSCSDRAGPAGWRGTADWLAGGVAASERSTGG